MISRKPRSCVLCLLVASSAVAALASTPDPVQASAPDRRPTLPFTITPPIIPFRSIDGSHNNRANPNWGSAGSMLLRSMFDADYADGQSLPPGTLLSGARHISNVVISQIDPIHNDRLISDFFWQWGQFLDHDIDLTLTMEPPEMFHISVPEGDAWFDPEATGNQIIPFLRSRHANLPGIRQQMNEISAFIDASNVYGSDTARAQALRRLDGSGKLKTSRGALLPYNTEGFENAPDSQDDSFFLAGDSRVNEQVALTAMHTLFVREHNYLADQIAELAPELDGDAIYQYARAIVAAEIQAITYNEFLPLLLGPNTLGPYPGYDENVDAGIANAFSVAAFRFGHSMLPSQLLVLDEFGQPMPQGSMPLREVFFAPERLTQLGIEPFLRGLAAQPAQAIDVFVVNEVRNFLFGEPGAGGLDLAALNIQRGRDHGMPRYNQCRRSMGLEPRKSFTEITFNPEVQARLAQVYEDVEDIDLWVGGLAEDPYEDAMLGELFFSIVKDQFDRLRRGDRFWYERVFPDNYVQWIEKQSLARIIRRNSKIGPMLQDDVFVVDEPETPGILPSLAGATLQLGTPFPNPARRAVSLWLRVTDTDGVAPPVAAEIMVFDARGRRVRSFPAPSSSAGVQTIRWDRCDDHGQEVPAGFYFMRVRSGEVSMGRKVLILD